MCGWVCTVLWAFLNGFLESMRSHLICSSSVLGGKERRKSKTAKMMREADNGLKESEGRRRALQTTVSSQNSNNNE